MSSSILCPKCGLVQMAAAKCRACGGPLGARPAAPAGPAMCWVGETDQVVGRALALGVILDTGERR